MLDVGVEGKREGPSEGPGMIISGLLASLSSGCFSLAGSPLLFFQGDNQLRLHLALFPEPPPLSPLQPSPAEPNRAQPSPTEPSRARPRLVTEKTLNHQCDIEEESDKVR